MFGYFGDMKIYFKLDFFSLVTFCLETKSNQKIQESSMLPRTKANARPLNFPANALKKKRRNQDIDNRLTLKLMAFPYKTMHFP